MLELPRLLTRPSLDYDLRFGIELHGIFALTVQNSKEALFPSAERKVRHRRGHSNIDSYVSGRRLVAEFARRRTTHSKQRSLVAIRAATNKIDSRIDRIGVNQAQHRS